MQRNKKTGATRNADNNPLLSWIIVSVVLALLVLLLIILDELPIEPAPVHPVQKIKKPVKQKYGFYDELPSRLVNNEVESSNANRVVTQSRALYQLQVGAFNEFKKADALKVSLIIIGIEANIHFNGNDLYRVRVGPSTDLQKIERVQAQLKAKNYLPLLQKL